MQTRDQRIYKVTLTGSDGTHIMLHIEPIKP